MKYAALMLIFSAVMPTASQTPAQKQKFEAASTKPNKSGSLTLQRPSEN
jgi:hypothetical protein